MIADRRYSLVAETKDDTKQTVTEAMGLVTYSNSVPTVLSYAAIFDSLWKQAEMYQQLQTHDIMQREFINIAAHQVRTPIQPILGLTEIVKNKTKDSEQKELLATVIKNANRLKKLSEDVLDVTKIESNTLDLNRERFYLKDVVANIVNNYQRWAGPEKHRNQTVYPL